MKRIIIAALALVLAVGVGLFMGRHAIQDALVGASSSAAMSSSLMDGLAGGGASAAPDEATAEADGPRLPEYSGPTAAYIEEGADNRDVELSFNESNDRPSTGLHTLTNRHINRVMQQNQRELLRCYGDQLAEYPDLAGEVEFEFAVYPEGNVAMVRVKESSLRSHEAEECFVERARHWTFPATDRTDLARFSTSIDFRF